jgi:hypothetical protein
MSQPLFRVECQDEKQDQRQDNHRPQAAQLRQVIEGREVLDMRYVEDEVRHRPREPGDEGDLHESQFEEDGREHHEHAEGEVQRAVDP